MGIQEKFALFLASSILPELQPYGQDFSQTVLVTLLNISEKQKKEKRDAIHQWRESRTCHGQDDLDPSPNGVKVGCAMVLRLIIVDLPQLLVESRYHSCTMISR